MKVSSSWVLVFSTGRDCFSGRAFGTGDMQDSQKSVTLRQLLGHRGGIGGGSL